MGAKPGFDLNGGTNLSDQFNFIVLYLGTVSHAGGSFALREKDDDVRDGIWAWLGSKVGSSSTADLFLEVQGKGTADLTPDAPSAIFPAQAPGSLPTQAKIDTSLFPPAL